VTFKTANIQQPTPAQRGSRAGDFASDLAALGLHSGQHGFDGGRDGDRERFAGSALGGREGQHTVFQIHAIERDLRLTQSAPRSQGNLKANSHPFWHTFDGQGFSGDFNFIVRKNRFDAIYWPPLNSVIKQSNRIHFSEQSALAVNPFKNLQILAGLVASSLAAGGAWKALAPLQINFAIGWRKRLQGYFFLTNKTSKMTPAISVIHFCQRGNGMILDQIINPVVAVVRSLFVHSNSGGLGRCLGAMQSIVDSVAGAFGAPLAGRIFEANKEPWGSFLNVRIGHGYNGNIYSV